ncbi:MAG: dihydrofolate reductase [Candidatus Gracilibacteria bacterium]|jgi:dihydrofolate reductase
MKNSKLYTIVAVEKNFGIGKKGAIPWNLKKEMSHFTNITTKVSDPKKRNGLIMGTITWLSLPEKYRPLKGRENVVLARETDNFHAEGCKVKHSFDEAIAYLKADENIENIFVMGGASIYRQAVENLDLDGLYITHLDKDYDCDTFFPRPPEKYSKITKLGEDEEDGVKFEFKLYEKN